MGMGGNNEAARCRSLLLDEQQLSPIEEKHLETLTAADAEEPSAEAQQK